MTYRDISDYDREFWGDGQQVVSSRMERSTQDAEVAHDGRLAKTVFALEDLQKASEMGRAAGAIEMQDTAVKVVHRFIAGDGLADPFMSDIAEAIAALPVPKVQVCNWTQDYNDAEYGSWKTGCDSYWYIEDGTPSDNNMKFCHGCGKPIAEHPYVDTEDTE